MDVDVRLLERFQRDPEPEGVLLGVGEGGPGRFLHHVAELTGKDELPLTRHHAHLDEHDVAADRGVVHPGGHADLGFPGLGLGEVAGRPQVLLKVLFGDSDALFALLQDAAGGLPEEASDLALEVADPRLAGVVGDQLPKGGVGDLDLALAEPVLLELPGQEEALGDLELFILQVGGELDELHPVH